MLCLSAFELYSRWVPLYKDASYLRTRSKGCSKIRRVLAKSRLISQKLSLKPKAFFKSIKQQRRVYL